MGLKLIDVSKIGPRNESMSVKLSKIVVCEDSIAKTLGIVSIALSQYVLLLWQFGYKISNTMPFNQKPLQEN